MSVNILVSNLHILIRKIYTQSMIMPLNMKKEPLDLLSPSGKLRKKRKRKIYTASRLEK